MKSYIFIKNAVILTATSILLRTIGIFFRIYLASAVGSEGMGLYQLCISLFVLGSTFATSGISTAVTRLVADNSHKGQKAIKTVVKTAAVVTAAVSVVFFVAFFFFSHQIAILLGDQRLSLSVKIMSFCFVFVGLSCCMRGYFIAKRKPAPPSIGQIFEEIVRIAVIVGIMCFYETDNVGLLCAIIMLGDTISEAFATGLLFIYYKKDIKGVENGNKVPSNCLKNVLRISLPLSAGKYLQTLLHTVENILVPLKLASFLDSKKGGLSQFGAIKGMAIPILFFPASLLTAFSTLLVPEISRERANGNKNGVMSTTEKAVSLTLKLSIVAAAIFFVCGRDIGYIIYKDYEVGQIIFALSPIVPFMYLESVCAALLKGLDKQMKLFWFNLADSLLRICAVFTIVPIFGLNGFLGIMIFSNIFTSSLTFACLIRVTGIKINLLNWILKPLILSTFGAFLGTLLTKNIGGVLIRCIFCAIITATIYLYAFYKENNSVMLTKKAIFPKKHINF